MGPQLPAEDGPQVQRSWQLPQWFLGRLWDKRGRGNVHLILREILDFVPQSQEQGKLQLGRGKVEVHIRLCVMQTLIASVRRSHTCRKPRVVLRSQVPPTMLPDGTLVVPIRDDADGSDDEEELSGIIEV